MGGCRSEKILDAESQNYVVLGPWISECFAWNLKEHGLFSEIYSFIISRCIFSRVLASAFYDVFL